MMKSALRWSSSCLVLGLVACKSEPELVEISSSQAALTASENSERALDGLLDAADFLSDSTSVAQTLSAMGGGQSCSSTGTSCAGVGCTPVVETTCSDSVDEADLEEMRADLKESAQELVQQLRERILIPTNLESETSTSATYRLGPNVLCDGEEPLSNAGSTPSYDPDCVERANQLQLRLRLTSPAEGDVDVTVLVGAQRNEPVVFELHQHSLGVKVDLGEALDVAREFGEDAEAIEQLSGVLELQLVENQPRDYSLDLNVLRALEAVLKSDGDTLRVSLGATSPALQLRVDGNAQRLLASMDLGALRVLGPLRLFADSFGQDDSIDFAPGSSDFAAPEPAPRQYRGTVEMLLAGLQGTLEYVADSDQLNLTNLGFGDETSFIKHDGQTLASLDLNATQGRHVNLLLEPEGERTKVTISPGFDLRMTLAFQHIADQVQGIENYLLNDTWHFWFDGDRPALIAGDEQLEVASGTLHLESAADPSANLSVSAGMCLIESDEELSSGADAWQHTLEVSACQ